MKGIYVDGVWSAAAGGDTRDVVDPSVMPDITNANIYAPVMMIAEKAADLIQGNEPLPAERVPVHRHVG